MIEADVFASPAEKRKSRISKTFTQLGGTGLEPVTPSLSSLATTRLVRTGVDKVSRRRNLGLVEWTWADSLGEETLTSR